MDALMAALVLGAVTQVGDRTPWLAAILADRFGNRALVLVAALLALAGNYALGTIGGVLIAPMLTPNAKSLLLALALLLAGLSTPWRAKPPERLDTWRIGAVATSVLGLAIMAFGDRMQFVAAALAARSPLPWAAPVGATIGAMGVVIAAVAMGEDAWVRLPLHWVRLGSAIVLTVAGVVIGLSALALI